MQRLLFFSTNISLFNRVVLVNDINFTIVINTTNHFLKNRAQYKSDIYFEKEGVITECPF